MRTILFSLAILSLLLPGPVRAQDPVFVQIEAHPSLREAQERARAYGGILQAVNGFSLGGGWYGIALGPFDEAQAEATLLGLRREGLIPRDSFINRGDGYRDRFWPLGAGAVAGARTRPPETGVGTADGPGIVALAPVAPPDETVRQARQSEALLDREAKRELQRALQWFGFYSAGIDGSFGRGTRNSMAAWQVENGIEATGVLTTRQRATLLEQYAEAQAALGLAEITVTEAGLRLTAPMGLVRFDRVEAPFVHYAPEGESGVRMSLISQPGDRAALGGLYEILQTLDIVPPQGAREKAPDSFSIQGLAPDRTTQVFARLQDGHIIGYLLSWPATQDDLAARALPEMERTLTSVGAPLPADAGFDPEAQSFDMVSGLEVRRPLRSASGFFVDRAGAVVTAAETVAGCGRITLDRLHEAELVLVQDGVAVLRPAGALAPVEVASLAPVEARLRSPVSVGGFPYGGVLGAATLSFGTLEDVRGLDGSDATLRLSLAAKDGDAGGPVLDGAGRVAGMLLPGPSDDGRALPEDVAFAVKARKLLDVLGAAQVQPATSDEAGPIAPEDLTLRARGMTVLVSCWD
ncbi:serine protease [Jannaschia ovalis]|uniref:Serine protease n=1 Tax=Jannaschia ovalis TaxID=3038773 RepID=A0ABY8LFV9_9RHOB|nr:serine protease [Jannaschia sp. GRR-S6-38]WGH79078.1 serine protease [Jannaschia sp. GRR-S6-38]